VALTTLDDVVTSTQPGLPLQFRWSFSSTLEAIPPPVSWIRNRIRHGVSAALSKSTSLVVMKSAPVSEPT
jgi:hypothetical protein